MSNVPRKMSENIPESVEHVQIPDSIIEFSQHNQFSIKAMTCFRHELDGKIEHFDSDAIYLKIKGYEVIIFREGLIKFTIEGLSGTVKKWGTKDLYGFIELSENVEELSQDIGLLQDIKAKSDALDPSIVSKSLHPSLKLEFDLQIVETDGSSYFQASNVRLITIKQLCQGEVKSFNPEKEYGFLISTDYKGEIYFHKSQIPSKELNSLRDGKTQ